MSLRKMISWPVAANMASMNCFCAADASGAESATKSATSLTFMNALPLKARFCWGVV